MTIISDDLKRTITSRLVFEESSRSPFSFAPSFVIFSNEDGFFHMSDIDLALEDAKAVFLGSDLSKSTLGIIDADLRAVTNPDSNRFPHRIIGTLNKNPLHPKVVRFPGGNDVLKVFHITSEFVSDLERPFSMILLEAIPAYQFNRQRVPIFDDGGLIIGSQPFRPARLHLFNTNGKELLIADLIDTDIDFLLSDSKSSKLIYIVHGRG